MRVPFSDPDSKLCDDTLLVVSQHSHPSDYKETKDCSLDKDEEQAGEVKDKLTGKKDGKVDHLNALQNIFEGLMMQASGVKNLTEIVEGMKSKTFPPC